MHEGGRWCDYWGSHGGARSIQGAITRLVLSVRMAALDSASSLAGRSLEAPWGSGCCNARDQLLVPAQRGKGK